MQNRRIFLGVALALVMLFINAGPALAGTFSGATDEIKQLKETVKVLMERVQDLERQVKTKKVAEKKGKEAKQQAIKAQTGGIQKIKEALGHLEVSGGVTTILQGTSGNDGNPPDYSNSTDATYTLDLNLATHLPQYGSFFVHLEGGEGGGLNNKVPSFSIPNYDAYPTRNPNHQCEVTISEAFYEFSLFDEKIAFDVGKMDISQFFDQNAAAGDETNQFLSNIFVKSMGLTIPEPDNYYCPGVAVYISPVEVLEFSVVGASVEHDNWDNVFDHGFFLCQVNARPKILSKRGNYRLYWWWDGRRHLNTRDLAVANGRTTPAYKDSLASKVQKGWGISFDQEIVEGITGFVRYSQTDDDLSRWNGSAWEQIPFDRLWTAGMELSGELWQREGDAMGLAYGRTLLTHDYRKANTHTGDETYMEWYYRMRLYDRFAISGDLQWVKNAGGNSRSDDIYIFGLRGQVDF